MTAIFTAITLGWIRLFFMLITHKLRILIATMLLLSIAATASAESIRILSTRDGDSECPLYIQGEVTFNPATGVAANGTSDQQNSSCIGDKVILQGNNPPFVGNYDNPLSLTPPAAVSKPMSAAGCIDSTGVYKIDEHGDPACYTLKPGFYPEGIIIKSDHASITFQPGLYIVAGHGLTIVQSHLADEGSIMATGVTFYILAGGIKMKSHQAITIKAATVGSTVNGAIPGVIIYQDPETAIDIDISDTTHLILQGVVDAPSANLKITGEIGLTYANSDIDANPVTVVPGIIINRVWIDAVGSITAKLPEIAPAILDYFTAEIAFLKCHGQFIVLYLSGNTCKFSDKFGNILEIDYSIGSDGYAYSGGRVITRTTLFVDSPRVINPPPNPIPFTYRQYQQACTPGLVYYF